MTDEAFAAVKDMGRDAKPFYRESLLALGRTYGFTDDEIMGITDPRLVKMMRDMAALKLTSGERR